MLPAGTVPGHQATHTTSGLDVSSGRWHSRRQLRAPEEASGAITAAVVQIRIAISQLCDIIRKSAGGLRGVPPRNCTNLAASSQPGLAALLTWAPASTTDRFLSCDTCHSRPCTGGRKNPTVHSRFGLHEISDIDAELSQPKERWVIVLMNGLQSRDRLPE